MASDVQYLPIRDFEDEYINQLLEMSRVSDEEEDPEVIRKPRARDDAVYDGECYSVYVDLILEGMGMEKYIPIFEEQDIGVNILLRLKINDLIELGITDAEDQKCILKNLKDFNVGEDMKYKELYRIEEDYVMAKNIYKHLIELNLHLSFINFLLKNNNFDDYFLNSRFTVLNVFKLIINRALTQSVRISNIIFGGSFKHDNDLIVGSLKVDNLVLPQFLKTKLMDISGQTSRRKKRVLNAVLLTAGIIASAFLFKKSKKY